MASVTQTHIPTCAVVLLLSLFKTVVYVAVFVASKKKLQKENRAP